MNLRTLLLAGLLALASGSLASADGAGLQWDWRVEPGTIKSGDEAEIVLSAAGRRGDRVFKEPFSIRLN